MLDAFISLLKSVDQQCTYMRFFSVLYIDGNLSTYLKKLAQKLHSDTPRNYGHETTCSCLAMKLFHMHIIYVDVLHIQERKAVTV